MKKLKTFAFCTLLAALAANHTPATAANGPTGDAAPATRDSEPKMYAWEQERDAIPSYTDLVLCYGGSHHRTPYRWDKERFTPFVTYVDEEGREHWLFDGFLFLEFQDSSRPDGGKYAYMVGVLRGQGISAGKQQWKELIDYWFDGDNGVNALEAAVKEASQRLGTPPAKRKVVMVMPDPIIYQKYDDTSESTTYWGSLDGRRMDFAKGADRVAACKWYIDQVRRRFDEGNYQYVELAGFYPISEEIVTPGDGYCHELKKSEEVIPQVAEYLHSINQSFCWIPYNRATPNGRRWASTTPTCSPTTIGTTRAQGRCHAISPTSRRTTWRWNSNSTRTSSRGSRTPTSTKKGSASIWKERKNTAYTEASR